MTNTLPKELELTSVLGGAVVQEMDRLVENAADFEVVSSAKPTDEQLEALVFAQKAVKHVKSNAILIAAQGQTLGIGAGQPNRIDSVKIAFKHAEAKKNFDQAVLASDAFFQWTIRSNLPLSMELKRSLNQVDRSRTKIRLRWQINLAWFWFSHIIVILDIKDDGKWLRF